MSVYINGLEMPKGQHTVTITICHDGYAVVEFRDRDDYPAKIETYQAVHVPPHGRVIDADAIMTKLNETSKRVFGNDSIPECSSLSIVADYIETAPTIIPASKESE